MEKEQSPAAKDGMESAQKPGNQIERYGGAPGVRDHALLEAALYRPQTHNADIRAMPPLNGRAGGIGRF